MMEYFAWSNLKDLNFHKTSAIRSFDAEICFGSTLKNQSKQLFDVFSNSIFCAALPEVPAK